MNKTLLILLKMTMRPSKKKTLKTNHPKYAKKILQMEIPVLLK